MDAVFKTEDGIFNYRVVGVWIKDGHILLHKAVNDSYWSLPGGRVKISEEAEIGLQREFHEELGIDITIERLIWSVENFFVYNDNNFHEIGFYYQVEAIENYKFSKEAFYGIEGERLIYKWTPIYELEEIALYPEFIKSEINGLPKYPKHIIVKDSNFK